MKCGSSDLHRSGKMGDPFEYRVLELDANPTPKLPPMKENKLEAYVGRRRLHLLSPPTPKRF